MKILVTICGRGGSKGVKNKNIRLIAGKPLIAYSIEQAKKWGKATRIVCSTDSDAIAEAAKKAGAEVPFIRPNELASDSAGKLAVIRHALTECEKIYNEKYDIVVDLDVTNPVRTTTDLDNCLSLFTKHTTNKNDNADLLFSITKSKKSPYFNMVEIDANGYAKLCKQPSNALSNSQTGHILRRQDAPYVYIINCNIYMYKRDFLINPKNTSVFSTDKIITYEMDEKAASDIDSELDLKYLEFLIKEKVVSL